MRILTGHTDQVKTVAISEDCKTIVSGSFDETVKVWRCETGELLHTLTGHEWQVNYFYQEFYNYFTNLYKIL